MKIERIDLKLVRLPLVRSFRTSSSSKAHLDHILVRVVADGVVGWGECASPSDPYYCPETTETCWHLLHDFLAPRLLGREWATVDEVVGFQAPVKGNNFAKAGLEMACWDLLARREGRPLAALLGGTRPEILSGVSLGIERDRGVLFGLIDRYLDEGYRRIKLKIAPGHDVEVVRAVRERYADIPLQVDANSAYTLDDLPTLKGLDAFDLLLIEQPLAHDDIIDHARLQGELAHADLPRREHPLGRRRAQGARARGLPGHQHQGQPRGRAARGEARPRRLPGEGGAGLVRRHARVRHRPRRQRRDREPAGVHPARRRLGLGQVLPRGRRRAARAGPSRGRPRARPGRGSATGRTRSASRRNTLREASLTA